MSARTNFMTPEQCAQQFEAYAEANKSEDSRHSFRLCAKFLREFCVQAPSARDTERMDWLEDFYSKSAFSPASLREFTQSVAIVGWRATIDAAMARTAANAQGRGK